MSPVNQSAKRINVPTRIIPGSRKPCAARTRTNIMKKSARAEVVSMYGKSLYRGCILLVTESRRD